MDQTFAIKGPSFDLRLSIWDKRMPPMYSRRVLCFALPSDTDERKQRIVHLLETALRSTVEELPFLAGSVVPLSKEQPWLHDLRPHGAASLQIKDLSHEINFSQLREAGFDSSLLDSDQLGPLSGLENTQDGPADVCRLQANFVAGGLLLAVSIIHTACDGRGISNVLEIFAKILRGLQTASSTEFPNRTQLDPMERFFFDRNTLLSSGGHRGSIDNHPGWTTLPSTRRGQHSPGRALSTLFHISSASLRLLKEVASPKLPRTSSPTHTSPAYLQNTSPDQAVKISTHDAVAALVWRTVIISRCKAGVISEESKTSFSQAVDCRTHLNLPEPYFGNAIYGVKASSTISQLASMTDSSEASQTKELGAAARLIRNEISLVTEHTFRDLLGFVERTIMEKPIRLAVLDELTSESVLLVSYFWFAMHDLDFGEALGGRIEAFRLLSNGLMPGVPVVLPRLPDGSCEFIINEPEEVVRYFAGNEFLERFAKRLP